MQAASAEAIVVACYDNSEYLRRRPLTIDVEHGKTLTLLWLE